VSELPFFDGNFYLLTVTKKIVMVTKQKNSKGGQKVFDISTDAVVICIGTEGDCQCHRYFSP